MRYMVIVKANAGSEAGTAPSARALAQLDRFNAALARAGILLAAEALFPSSEGARLRYAGRDRPVLREGPFACGDLAAGFWLWQVHSREEALEWARRIPNPDGAEFEVELRRVLDAGVPPADGDDPGDAPWGAHRQYRA